MPWANSSTESVGGYNKQCQNLVLAHDQVGGHRGALKVNQPIEITYYLLIKELTALPDHDSPGMYQDAEMSAFTVLVPTAFCLRGIQFNVSSLHQARLQIKSDGSPLKGNRNKNGGPPRNRVSRERPLGSSLRAPQSAAARSPRR